MDLDIKTLSLLFMGAAVLLIVFSFKRGKHPGQDESLKGLTSKLARSQNVTIPLDRIARLSWLKGEGDLYVEDMELAKELYSYPEDKARKSRGLFKAQTGFAYPASGVDNEQTPACIREFHAHKNEVTSAFFEEVIRPFLPKLIQNDTLDIIMKILTFLSTEGDIPSVVSADRQNKDLGYTYTFLKQVSLAQHSINTAKIGMDILRNEFLFYYDITPDKYLTLFLGHDLGKTAPSKNYSLQDHPILSAQILSSFIPDSVSWKEEALETVKNHHMSIKLDQPHETPEKSDLWLLQTADRKAREIEIQSVSAQIGNPTESWGVQPEGWQTTGQDSPQPEAAQDNETLQSGRQPADQRGVPTPLDASYPHKHDESPAPPAGTNQVRPACQTGRGQAGGQAPPEIGGQAPPEVGGQAPPEVGGQAPPETGRQAPPKTGEPAGTVPMPDSPLPGERPRPSGMLPAELLGKILPVINRLVSPDDTSNTGLPIPPETPHGNFLALSQPDGIAYVRPDVIYYAFLSVVNEKSLQRENAAILAKPKNEALKDIVHWLIDNNCLPPRHIKPGYYGRWYMLDLGGKSYKALFTPIIIHIFGVMPGELEAKRREIAKIANITIKKTNRGHSG